jgi:hypothetical protein
MSGFFKRLTGKKREEAYSGSAHENIGWLWDEPSSAYLNVTPRFEEFIGRLVDNSFSTKHFILLRGTRTQSRAELPEDAGRYTYLLIPGLFTNKVRH